MTTATPPGNASQAAFMEAAGFRITPSVQNGRMFEENVGGDTLYAGPAKQKRERTMHKRYWRKGPRIVAGGGPSPDRGFLFVGRDRATDPGWVAMHEDNGDQPLPKELGFGIEGSEIDSAGWALFLKNGGLTALDPNGNYWMPREQVVALGWHNHPWVLEMRPDVAEYGAAFHHPCKLCPHLQPFNSPQAFQSHRKVHHKTSEQGEFMGDAIGQALGPIVERLTGGSRPTSNDDLAQLIINRPDVARAIALQMAGMATPPSPVAEESEEELPMTEEPLPANVFEPLVSASASAPRRDGDLALRDVKKWMAANGLREYVTPTLSLDQAFDLIEERFPI